MTPWAWAGAGVGALLGHAIGVHTCHNHWRQAYYDQYGAPPPHPAYYPYAYYHPAHTYYAGWYRYHAHHPAAAQGYAYYYYWRGYRDAERYHEQAAPVPSGEGG